MSEDRTHIHSYKRVKHPTRRDIFMCTSGKCSHTRNAMYLVGKEAKCPYCGETFLIEKRYNLDKQSLLHCRNCKRGKRNGKGTISAEDLLKQAFSEGRNLAE